MCSTRGMKYAEVFACNSRVRVYCDIFKESQVFNELKCASPNIPSLDSLAYLVIQKRLKNILIH